MNFPATALSGCKGQTLETTELESEGPLTETQRGIWYACNAHGNQSLYLTAQAIVLCGVDIDRLAGAIRQACSETEVFNYIFDRVHPLCKPAHPAPAANIRIFHPDDLTLPDTEDGLMALRAWMSKDICINSGPLHAHYIYSLWGKRCLWVCAVHHIAFDNYSYALLIKRVLEIYASVENEDRASSRYHRKLSELAEEELRYKLSEDFNRSRRYWGDQCLDQYAPVYLFERNAYPLTEIVLSEELQLEAPDAELILSGINGDSTAFPEILLAAIASYFARINNSDKILFGFGMMGRLGSVAAELPSSHVNILPLTVSLCLGQSCRSLRENIREKLLKLRKHQKYRGEWIARDYGKTAIDNPLCLIDVHLIPMAQLPESQNITLESVRQLITGPVRDSRLFIQFAFEQKRISLRLEAAAPASRKELCAHLGRLASWIGTVARHDAEEVYALSMILPEEQCLLERWNSTAQDQPESDIATLFEAQVAATPNKIALIFENKQITYHDLNRRADRFARKIQQIIPSPQSAIAIAMDRSIELEVALLAIFKIGAAYMPIPDDYPEERVCTMCHDAQIDVAITHSHRQAQIPRKIKLIMADTELDVSASDGKAIEPLVSYRRATNIAYVIFTSGTTGKPKGVLVEQRALVNRILWMQHAYPISTGDKVLQKTPYGFDVSVWELFWPIITGSTLVMGEPGIHLSPQKLLSVIERDRVTVIHFVPSMLDLFVEYLSGNLNGHTELPLAAPSSCADDSQQKRMAAAASSLTRIFCSGEALAPETIHRTHQNLAAEIVNLYGPTEAAIDVTHKAIPRRGEPLRTVPLGRPIWNTKIHVLDGALHPLPIGVSGEICIEGLCLAKGYAGNPELTSNRFIFRNGCRLYRTGDVGRWNYDGEIEYRGRMDRQVKLRGLRIELGEIESVISEDNEVVRACAEVLSGSIVAFIVIASKARKHSQQIVDRIKKACWRKLAQYMVPRDVICVDAFPYTSNGKLDRRELSRFLASRHSFSESTRSESLLEYMLCKFFEELLGVGKISPTDNFFELGGDSLRAIKLALMIQEHTGWEISIANIFSSPTPRLLAENGGNSSVDDGLGTKIILRPSPNSSHFVPALFCIHPAGGIAWCFAKLAKFLQSPCEIVGIQAEGLRNPNAAAKSMGQIARDYAEVIISHQKNGPYRLLGWSVGGMIAHAVACKLQEQGHRVELLALMDSYPSDLWAFLSDIPLNPQEEESLALAALLYIAGISLPGSDSAVGASIFLSPIRQITNQEAIALLREHDSPLSTLDDDVLRNLVKVVVNSRRIVSSAKHDMFDGDMLFFTAAHPRVETWLDHSAWQRYLAGTLTNIDIDCDHPSLARQGAMREIAAGIDTYLKSNLQRT
jgi:enterobactin synthetase component F